MIGKKINQLPTELAPVTTDLTIIGDPVTGVSKKITLSQIANLFATSGTVTSVAASITGNSIGITGSPITTSGTLAFAFAGNATQYVRGDGQLSTLPTGGGGGGASVSYYLNGSINQGTIGGVTYYEMNKTPIIGAGTDFTRSSNGYIASFLTDANDPALLNIPAGNWNFETYLEASSGGGSPTFYIELYKYDGTTFTLIASNSINPKLINDGTNVEAYFTALAVPQTTLTLTDRLAIRIYVTTAGRTITLHTENSNLCQIITTFTTGLTALNGLTSQVQYFATGTSGTDFNISSATSTHTFNLPTASATNRGALSSADWTTFNNKQNALTNPITGTGASGQVAFFNGTTSLTGTNNFFWDTANNRLGIGLTNPQRSIEIFNSTADNHLRLSGNAPSVSMGEAVTGSVYQAKFGLVTTNGQFAAAGLAGDFVIISQTGATIFVTNSTEKMRVQASGNMCVGNTNNTYRLDVTGTGRFTGQLRLESTITDGTNTYTLPSATGTLALTSQLTGGTVTSVGLSSATSGVTIGSTPITTSGTITLAIDTATGSQQGLLSSTDWTTFNGKQAALNGTGFVKISGTTISYDNSTYLTTSAASSTYLPLTGGTLTGALNGTSAVFSSSVSVASLNTNRPSTTTSNPLIWNTAGVSDWFLGSSPLGTSTSDLSLYSYGTSSVVLNIVRSTGAATFSSTISTSGGRVTIQGTNQNSIWFNQNAGGTSTGYLIGRSFGSTDSQDFFIYDVLAASPRLFINSSGSVGIGTTSPYSTLHVNQGNTSATLITVGNNNGGNLFGVNGGGQGLITTYGDADLIFGKNYAFSFAETMRISSGGNVLVSTTTSTASVFKFQVGNGTSDSRAFFNPSNAFAIGIANGGSSAWYIGVNAQTAANGLQFYSNNLGGVAMTIKTTSIINFSNVPSSSAGLSSGDIYKTVAGVLMIV